MHQHPPPAHVTLENTENLGDLFICVHLSDLAAGASADRLERGD